MKAIASLARFALLARAVGAPLLGFALELVRFGTGESEEAGGGANSEPPALLRFSPELGLRWSAELRLPSGCFSASRGSCTMPRASSRLPLRRTYERHKAGVAVARRWRASHTHICQLAEAGRGWPRQEAEAGGRPELDLALAGRIKAGGRRGRSLWAAALHTAARLGLLAAPLAAVHLRRLLAEACSAREADARRAARPARPKGGAVGHTRHTVVTPCASSSRRAPAPVPL